MDNLYIYKEVDDPETIELLTMTRAVLKSGTGYSDTLIANIRSFHHAMKTEKRLNGFEERLGKIEEKEKSRKEKALRIREDDMRRKGTPS